GSGQAGFESPMKNAAWLFDFIRTCEGDPNPRRECKSIGLPDVTLETLREIVAAGPIKPAVVQIESQVMDVLFTDARAHDHLASLLHRYRCADHQKSTYAFKPRTGASRRFDCALGLTTY